MARVGVIISGCGFQDGAEIQETVFTMLALDQAGAEVVCMAPDIPQSGTVNHLTGKEAEEPRNVLAESARIVRGNISNIKDINPDSLDALILPGGYGAAKNLSTFAADGANCSVNPDVAAMVNSFFEQNKPMGFICIAPVIAAKVLGDKGIKLTIGTNEDVADAIGKMGARHEACVVDDIVVDLENRIISTPAYMLGPGPKDVAKGIEKLVREVLRFVKER